MITKKYGVDFPLKHNPRFSNPFYTLEVEEVSLDSNVTGGVHTKTHKDGWTIRGKVCEDYYTWVEEFTAEHPDFGRVWGNFREVVFAECEEGFEHFHKNHPPLLWDADDI